MSKDDAINIINSSNRIAESGVLYIFFIIYTKMSEFNFVESAYLTYFQRNREVILDRAKNCYENDKKRLREPARDKDRNLFEEEKIKKDNMGKIDIAICPKKRNKD